MTMKTILNFIAAVALGSSVMWLSGCFESSSDPAADDGGGGTIVLDDPNPPTVITGTTLACDKTSIQTSETAADYAVDGPDSIPAYNVSRETAGRTSDTASEFRASAGNNLKRLWFPVVPMTAGDPDALDPDVKGSPVPIADWDGTEDMVHPLLVSYTEQVIGDYEMGDGSADIGDPTNIDDAFVSLSLDNGRSWKKQRVGDTAMLNDGTIKSSIQVMWDGVLIDYPGHSHKMTMNVYGNNILTAWLDKYCPSGNPYDLEQVEVDGSTTYPDDLYQVNGTQGSVNYELPCTVTDPTSLEYNCAPNGKPVFEVPFSCVWAARGIFDPETGIIEWRQAEQVTSGTRDANKIWIASEEVGFAVAWQEDPEGLRSGKGEGPGDGWSGATTNHGADIWYTHITMQDFDDVCTELDDQGTADPSDDVCTTVSDDPVVIAALETKPKPAVKFTYPVRVTDNEACFVDGDTKLYCEEVCTDSTTVDSNNQKDQEIVRCLTGDIDPLPQWDGDTLVEDAYAALDGDTGASRPALTILKTNTAEFITVLAYEETKGLSAAEPGVPDDPDALDIALEGKVVLAEAFMWDDPVTVSAGNIVNVKVPRFDSETGTFDTNDMIYENARRVVLMHQVDACEMTANSYPIGFLYKQSYDTQGGPSDMYVRLVRSVSLETLEDVVYNVSSQSVDLELGQYDVEDLTWSLDNLNDYVGTNPYDNTFSPRGFLRGDEIYVGYAYTPDDARTLNLGVAGQIGSNFWIHRNLTGAPDGWLGPQQITFEQGGTSALDPRFVPTPEYNPDGVAAGLASDLSNPNVLLMSYNTADVDHELDVYYARSTDKGETWEYITVSDNGTPDDTTDDTVRFAKISAWPLPVEEKEVQLVASPDGNMGFNVWLQESEVPPGEGDLTVTVGETEVTIPEQFLGLESWLGRVDWTDPATHVVVPE
jgi:hypothetical protein